MLSRLFTMFGRREAPTGTGPAVTRRGLTLGAGSGLLVGAVPAQAAAVPWGLAALDRPGLDMLVRGIAALDQTQEDGLADQAARMVAEIAAILPEAPALVEVYRRFPSGGSERGVWRRPATVDMDLIESAIHAARSVVLRYRDLKGDETVREILPLALVYPDHGVFVLAWCRLRGGYRQFFAHALLEVAPGAGSFAGERLALLEGLAAHHRGRA